MSTAVARAPGRVNLIGEHTDYNGGLCLPFAIDLATTARVTARPDRRIVATSDQTTPGDGTWQRYVVGVVAELRQLGWEVPGPDVEVTSTVPLGGGLSSSASLECAVATAIAGLLGVHLDAAIRRALAEACQRAESVHVGAPTGGLDQLASMLCRAGEALLIDFADPIAPSTTPITLPLAEHGLAILVTDTRTRHQLSDGDGGYARRRAECEAGDPRRLRHVRTESLRVASAVEEIAAARWDHLGALMIASHDSLRDDFEVSTSELDLAVETALALDALGARMTGGGFGGCTIALVPHERADTVRQGIDQAYAERGWTPPIHHEVRPAEGARLLSPQAPPDA